MNWNINNICLISLPLIFSLQGCSGNSSIKDQYEAERMFLKANKLYQRVMINPRIASVSDYQSAVSAFENILSKYSQMTSNETIESIKKRSFLTLAQLWILQGEIHSAIQVFDAFLKAYPEDKDFGMMVHLANARCNERIFNIHKAISEYQTLLDSFGQIQDPYEPDLNLMTLPLKVARLESSSKLNSNLNALYSDALNYYNSIVERWPNSPAAFYASYYMSSIYADQKKWDKVINILNILIKEYPAREEIPNILLTLGNIHLDVLNNPSRALNIFEELLAKYPDHEITGYIHLAKARAFYRQGKHKLARELLQWIIKNFPKDQNLGASAQLTLGSIYETEGKWDRALVEYRWIKDKYPVTPQGLTVPLYIAEHYRQIGENNLAQNAFQEAIAQYTNLVKKYPKTVLAAIAQEYIIYCLSAQEKWLEAAEAANSLRNIYPGSGATISSYLFLGEIYEKLNQFRDAVEIYEKFLREYPQHPLGAQVQGKIKVLRKRS